MNSEGKFWCTIWAIIGVLVCTLIISVTAYNINQTNKETELVKAGADPIALACAKGYTSSCLVLAKK